MRYNKNNNNNNNNNNNDNYNNNKIIKNSNNNNTGNDNNTCRIIYTYGQKKSLNRFRRGSNWGSQASQASTQHNRLSRRLFDDDAK